MDVDYLYSKNDVFSDELRLDVIKASEKHFRNNLLDDDNGIFQITESIIDCHGLALSPSSFFPYTERCWNIFVLKIRDLVYEYCDNAGISWHSMIPFSLYGERISYTQYEGVPREKWNHKIYSRTYEAGNHYDLRKWKTGKNITGLRNTSNPKLQSDGQVKKTFIRCVYYMQNKDDSFGTHVETSEEVVRHKGIENSVLIYCSSELPSYNILAHNPETVEVTPPTNIIFEWYINDPFDVPDWVLP